MLVKDLINAMESGQLTGKQLAEQYKVSTRTISKKISNLGYKYDNTNKTYSFLGDNLDVVEGLEFASLFDSAPLKTPSTTPAAEKTTKPTAPKPTKKPATPVKKDLDAIDKLLAASEKPERIYRGYYFDADILAIIDKSSNKSALINECLRAVFKEKGLL